jgi:hypothetical protein
MSLPILGQGTSPPDRFDREFGGAYNRSELAQGDLQDSEYLVGEAIVKSLMEKYETRSFTFAEFEREAKDRFYDAGFVVDVTWHRFKKNGVLVPDGRAPQIDIVGRAEPTTFDHDRKVHEVTSNILDLPGESGVIKSSGAIAERNHPR